jgi:adhesin transport system membrane fusion protein
MKLPKFMNNPEYNKRGRSLLSESIQIEEELVPGFVKPTLWLIAGVLISFILWASVTPMKEVAKGLGEIIPSDKVKVVQHLEGGIVAEIITEERRLVNKDDLLLRMDGTQVVAEMQQLEARLASLALREERLLAFTENRKPNFNQLVSSEYASQVSSQMDTFFKQSDTRASSLAILDRQVLQRRKRLQQVEKALNAAGQDIQLANELSSMREDLAERKLINRSVLLETRRARVAAEGEVGRQTEELAMAQQELAESISKREDAANQIQRDALKELGEVQAEQAEVGKTLDKQRSIVGHLEVRAPTHGLVQDLQVHTTGQVVQPGSILMKIVPSDAILEAEIKIDPKDIGFVQIGQAVKLRVSSYDYSRFGYANGVLKRVSAFSIIDDKDPKQTAFFKAWIALDKPYVGEIAGQNMLQPGMAVEAEVTTGEKKLIAYLLKPVADLFSKSFHER